MSSGPVRLERDGRPRRRQLRLAAAEPVRRCARGAGSRRRSTSSSAAGRGRCCSAPRGASSAAASTSSLFAALDGLRRGGADCSTGWSTVARRVDRLPCPTVFAAHALCLTWAFELALACDLILAAESAAFGLVETVIGLTPAMGGTQRLAERAGTGRAREFVMTGVPVRRRRRSSAGTSSTGCCPTRASTRPPGRSPPSSPPARRCAHAATKQVIRDYLEGGVALANERVRQVAGELFDTEDLSGAVRSFLERGPGQGDVRGSLSGRRLRPPAPSCYVFPRLAGSRTGPGRVEQEQRSKGSRWQRVPSSGSATTRASASSRRTMAAATCSSTSAGISGRRLPLAGRGLEGLLRGGGWPQGPEGGQRHEALALGACVARSGQRAAARRAHRARRCTQLQPAGSCSMEVMKRSSLACSRRWSRRGAAPRPGRGVGQDHRARCDRSRRSSRPTVRPACAVAAARSSSPGRPRSRRSATASPTRRRSSRPGQIVAFTVGLSACRADRDHAPSYINVLDAPTAAHPGRDHRAEAGRRNKKRIWKVAAESPTFHLQPFLGQVVAVPARRRTLEVQPGDIVALTVPTWAPVLRSTCRRKQFAYRQSRRPTAARRPAPSQAQLDGRPAGTRYSCDYTGTRVEYTATEITSPPYPKNAVHARCTGATSRNRR